MAYGDGQGHAGHDAPVSPDFQELIPFGADGVEPPGPVEDRPLGRLLDQGVPFLGFREGGGRRDRDVSYLHAAEVRSRSESHTFRSSSAGNHTGVDSVGHQARLAKLGLGFPGASIESPAAAGRSSAGVLESLLVGSNMAPSFRLKLSKNNGAR